MAQRVSSPTPVLYRVAPTARVEIVFYFGDPWSIGETHSSLRPLANLGILPARRSSYYQQAGPKIDWPLIALTPLGCQTILGVKLASLWSEADVVTIALEAKFRSLYRALCEEQSPAQRFSLTYKLLRKLVEPDLRDPLLEKAHEARFTPIKTARDFARGLSITDRQLRNRFRQEIGPTPKDYLRILRFNRHLSAIHPAPWTREAQASDTELFDDSHAAREFRRHIGISPSQYRKLKAAGADPLVYTL